MVVVELGKRPLRDHAAETLLPAFCARFAHELFVGIQQALTLLLPDAILCLFRTEFRLFSLPLKRLCAGAEDFFRFPLQADFPRKLKYAPVVFFFEQPDIPEVLNRVGGYKTKLFVLPSRRGMKHQLDGFKTFNIVRVPEERLPEILPLQIQSLLIHAGGKAFAGFRRLYFFF